MKKKEMGDKAKELLKKAAESLEEHPEQEAPAAPQPEEKPKSILSDKRKRALINYMAILFAVAFLLVALSLAIQRRDSQAQITSLGATANSALEKADQLQETNRLLQSQLDEATATLNSLESELALAQSQLRTNAEAQQSLADSNQELQQAKETAEQQATAYKLLAQAYSARDNEDLKGLQDALAALEPESQYLDKADLAAYQSLVSQLAELEKDEANQAEDTQETGEVE